MFIVKRLDNKINLKSMGASQPKVLNQIVNPSLCDHENPANTTKGE